MSHFNEEILYKFVLDTLDSPKSNEIRNHSSKCELCQQRIEEIRRQIEILESFNPEIEMNRTTDKSSNNMKWIIPKAAAVILIGLIIGYSVSNYTIKEEIVVVGQSFIPHNNLMDSLRFVDCPNIDINTKY